MRIHKRVSAVIKKEFLHIIRDKVLFMLAFIAPFALMFLMGFVYSEHKVTNIPIVIFDRDQTELSRTISRAFADSERMKIIANVSTYEEMQKYLDTEKAFMGVVIPPGLKADLKKGSPAEVGLLLNASNILTLNTLANAAASVIQTISAGVTIKVMEGNGISQKKAYNAVSAISFRSRYLYNPTGSYLIFMLTGLIGTIIQQLALLGIALSISRERENGTWKNLMFSNLSGFEVLLGKFIVYFLIYTLDAILMYLIAFKFFSIPMNGDALLALGTIVLFVIVVLVIGMAISAIISSQVQAIETAMTLAVPSFILSGYTWPMMSMPGWLQNVSNFLPLTHFLEAMKMQLLLGQGYEVVKGELEILALFIVIALPLTLFFVNKKLSTS